MYLNLADDQLTCIQHISTFQYGQCHDKILWFKQCLSSSYALQVSLACRGRVERDFAEVHQNTWLPTLKPWKVLKILWHQMLQMFTSLGVWVCQILLNQCFNYLPILICIVNIVMEFWDTRIWYRPYNFGSYTAYVSDFCCYDTSLLLINLTRNELIKSNVIFN